jgi:hypothetical protein
MLNWRGSAGIFRWGKSRYFLDEVVLQFHEAFLMKFFRPAVLITLSCSSLLFSSCAQKFTAAQRAQLSTVSVARTEVDPEAYQEPHGGDIRARNGAAMGGTAAGGGIAGPLVGWAVGSAIAGTQNANFKGKNSGHFANVRRNTPGDLGEQLTAVLKKDLKADPFFKTRLVEKSTNVVGSKIHSYRLVRREKDDQGELKFSPEILLEIHLNDAAGKSLAGTRFVAAGTESHRISEYASNPALSRRVYQSTLDQAAKVFMDELGRKTAE